MVLTSSGMKAFWCIEMEYVWWFLITVSNSLLDGTCCRMWSNSSEFKNILITVFIGKSSISLIFYPIRIVIYVIYLCMSSGSNVCNYVGCMYISPLISCCMIITYPLFQQSVLITNQITYYLVFSEFQLILVIFSKGSCNYSCCMCGD